MTTSSRYIDGVSPLVNLLQSICSITSRGHGQLGQNYRQLEVEQGGNANGPEPGGLSGGSAALRKTARAVMSREELSTTQY